MSLDIKQMTAADYGRKVVSDRILKELSIWNKGVHEV